MRILALVLQGKYSIGIGKTHEFRKLLEKSGPRKNGHFRGLWQGKGGGLLSSEAKRGVHFSGIRDKSGQVG